MRRFASGLALSLALLWPGAGFATQRAEVPTKIEQPNPAPVRLVASGIEPMFDAIGRDEGLRSSYVWKVSADRHGFVWIAGNSGVHRYDGHHIYSLDRDPNRRDSLASRDNRFVVPTREAIWFASDDGTLQRLDTANERLTAVPVKTREGASPKLIVWLGGDANDRIWMLTELGLLRYDPNTSAVVVAKLPKDGSPVLTMAFSADARHLFVVSNGHSVVDVDVNAPEKVRALLTNPDREPISAMAAEGPNLWLAAGKALWKFDAASGSMQKTELPVESLYATSMVVDANGIVWFGSEYDLGLHRFDSRERTLTIYKHRPEDPSSMTSDRMLSLAIDRHNNLWIGLLTGGVSRLRLGQDVVTRYSLPGSRGRSVCAMQEGEGRQLLLALCGNSLARLDLDTGQVTDLAPELDRALPAPSPALNAHVLVKDGRGGVWIPTGREGLLRWHPREGTVQIPSRSEDGKSELPGLYFTGAFLGADRKLWITSNRGLTVLEPGAAYVREISVLDRKREIKFIGHDVTGGPDDSLWVSSNIGLIRYWPKQQRVLQFRHDPNDRRSLSDNRVLQAYTDRLGHVWVATQAGLNRMVVVDKGTVRFQRYGIAEGLPDMTVSAITSDTQDALWVGTNRGIARWDPKLDRFESYLKPDGVPDGEIGKGAAFLSSDRGLYFGGVDGVWRLDAERVRMAKSAPVLLSDYEAGGRRAVNLRGSELQSLGARYDDGRITFRIAVLGDSRRLSYRLVGLDERWQDMPSDLSVSYHRLAPGSYQFEVRQLDNRGGWRSPELSIPLEVAPPPWKQPWAYLLYALAAAALVALVARQYLVRRRRRLEHLRELQERDERLRMSMQASGDVMIEIDLTHGRVVHVGESMLGYELGKLPTEIDEYFALTNGLIHPDDAHVAKSLRESLLARRAIDSEVEYRLRKPDGTWAWVRLRGQLIERHSQEGRIELFTGMLHDITEDRHTRELRQKAYETQLQAETKGRVLAMMSHEIRTPMNGVVGTIELLDRMPLGRAQQKVLETCKDSVSVLMSVVNDVLDFSKIESGKLQLERAPLSPRRLIESVASAFGIQATKRGIDLDLHVDPAVPARILGDRVRLHQILTNLVSNSVKFTERGGVSISAVMAAPDVLCISIADTGIGMDEETVQNLYQPYQQADATTVRRYGGTGLGLSIAQHLTQMMGGRIACDSRIGEGACFTVTIPSDAVSPGRPAAKPLSGVRVLVLANVGRQSIIGEPLSLLGADVDFAQDIEVLKSRPRDQQNQAVDVVLIDRGEGTQERLAAMKADPSLARRPIILLQAGGTLDTPMGGGIVVIEGNPLVRAELVRGVELALGRVDAPAKGVPSEAKGGEVSEWREPEAAPGRMILLAEDNPTNREVITHQLNQLGCTCDVVEDGEQAWMKLLAHPDRYDLLITDGYMPRLDGYQLAERIRRLEHEHKRSRLKILALTANADKGEEARCLSIGMDGYLAKPVRMDDLLGMLSELLPEGISNEPSVCVPGQAKPGLPLGLSALAEMLQGDEAKLARLLRIFTDTTRNDLLALEAARQSMDRSAVARLAHRLKSACMQMGEQSTWQALDELEGAARSTQVDDALLNQLLEVARNETEQTLARVEQYGASPLQVAESRGARS
ncbi:ATP-binding protein [Montanilutibacter psychrotolerans]|nr:ATP-binding protein [Lysobacter psychrotolerans]